MVKKTHSQDVLSTLKTLGHNFGTLGKRLWFLPFKLFVVDMPIPNLQVNFHKFSY